MKHNSEQDAETLVRNSKAYKFLKNRTASDEAVYNKLEELSLVATTGQLKIINRAKEILVSNNNSSET